MLKRKHLTMAIVLAFKFTAIYFIIQWALSGIDTNIPLYRQPFKVWAHLIVPSTLGIESLINMIFSKEK